MELHSGTCAGIKEIIVHLHIGQREKQLPIKAARPPQRGVQCIRPVGCADDHHLQ